MISYLRRYTIRLFLVGLFALAGGVATHYLMLSTWSGESTLVRLRSLESPSASPEAREAGEEFGAPEGWEAESLPAVVEMLSGEEEGKYLSVVLEQNLMDALPLETGKIYLLLGDHFPDGTSQYYISDSFRAPWVVAMIFAAMGGLLASAGLAGFRALLGLLLSLGALLFWYVPSLEHGVSPTLYAVGVVSMIIALTVVLVVQRKSWWPVAFLGSVGGAVAASLLGWFLVELWQLSGLAGEGGALLSSTLPQLNLRGILLASVIIGAIGAVLDVGISVTATMGELVNYDPEIPAERLWNAGMRAGREVLGSMINTLILAYVGSALPFVLLVAHSGISLAGFLNNPSIAEELVRSLAGTAGLLLTVPITAFVGMLWHRKNLRNG